TITDGSKQLSAQCDLSPAVAARSIQAMLNCGYDLEHPETHRPLFAFRLHQFISRGDTVFSTLDRGTAREMTLDGQTALPSDTNRRLYPLAFCRSCGEDYFVVDIPEGSIQPRLSSRDFRDMARQDDEERSSGYV